MDYSNGTTKVNSEEKKALVKSQTIIQRPGIFMFYNERIGHIITTYNQYIPFQYNQPVKYLSHDVVAFFLCLCYNDKRETTCIIKFANSKLNNNYIEVWDNIDLPCLKVLNNPEVTFYKDVQTHKESFNLPQWNCHLKEKFLLRTNMVPLEDITAI